MRRESVQPTHSPRSNIAGSIDSARRTGIHLATSPSKDIARATPVSTSGSRSCLVHETRPVCRLPLKRCVRVREGGEVRETVTVDRGCFACMLGGVDTKRCRIGGSADRTGAHLRGAVTPRRVAIENLWLKNGAIS